MNEKPFDFKDLMQLGMFIISLLTFICLEFTSGFQTDVEKIMGMLKCKNKGDDLQKYMKKNKAFFEHLDYNTSQAIGEFLQSEQLRKMTKRDNRLSES